MLLRYSIRRKERMAETMEQKGMELMQRRDVPEHIREAAYIMLGVFSRLAESEKEKQNADEVIWVDEGSEACCQ